MAEYRPSEAITAIKGAVEDQLIQKDSDHVITKGELVDILDAAFERARDSEWQAYMGQDL